MRKMFVLLLLIGLMLNLTLAKNNIYMINSPLTRPLIDNTYVYEYKVTTKEFLSDFQINVTLPVTNIPLNSIRVISYDENGNRIILPHWVEISSQNKVIIWTKLPKITNKTRIYVTFGNSNLPDISNGSQVFEFFDDFDKSTLDTSKWSIVGSPIILVSNSTLKMTASSRGEGIIVNKDYTNKIIIETKMRITSGNYYSTGISWKFKDQLTHYHFDVWRTENNIRIIRVVNGYATTLSYTRFVYSLNKWYIQQVYIINNTYIGNVYDQDWNKVLTLSTTDSELTGTKIGFLQHAYAQETSEVDWFRVRKYTSNPPQITLVRNYRIIKTTT